MKLETYLSDNGITYASFAESLGVTGEAVRQWAGGSRHPRPRHMLRIMEETGGEVQPQDFLSAPEAAA